MDYSKSRVIIIDDDSTTRRIVSRLVKQIGFMEFVEAEDGQQAYDLMQESDFDLVLSDLDMPVMNGMELLEKVRADERLSKIPFIMVTANDSKENIMRAVKAHVSQYIVKPFTATALKEKIAKVLDQS
jgi:two-component system chemotaxis response regulator CheY